MDTSKKAKIFMNLTFGATAISLMFHLPLGEGIFEMFSDTRIFSSIPMWAYGLWLVKNRQGLYNTELDWKSRKNISNSPWIFLFMVGMFTLFTVIITTGMTS